MGYIIYEEIVEKFISDNNLEVYYNGIYRPIYLGFIRLSRSLLLYAYLYRGDILYLDIEINYKNYIFEWPWEEKDFINIKERYNNITGKKVLIDILSYLNYKNYIKDKYNLI